MSCENARYPDSLILEEVGNLIFNERFKLATDEAFL